MKYLIVVDMQNDFTVGSLGTKEAQAIVPNVVKKIEEYDKDDFEIFFTKDTHGENYLKTQEGKNLPVKHCIIGTEGWNLDFDVEKAKNLLKNAQPHVYEKSTFGSAHMARAVAVYPEIPDSIEFVGLCTDICVISNVLLLKAYMPEVPVIVDASCCAGTTPERHKAALEVMKSCQIEIINESEERRNV